VASRRDAEKARAEKAEQRAAALEQQLRTAARSARPTATAENPLADVQTAQEFQSAVQEYRDLREWAQANPDGIEGVVVGKNDDGTPKTRDYTAQEMAAIVAKTTRILDEHVPAKAQLLAVQAGHEQVAREKLPEMFQEGTEANRFYRAALDQVPGITNIPGTANWIRWAWMGRALDIENAKAAAEAAGKNGDGKNKAKVSPEAAPFLQKHKTIAPGVPSARASAEEPARRQAAGAEEVKKARERVIDGGGEEAEVDFVSALRDSQAAEKGVLV
jgi:hypothetical protein